MPAKMKDYPLYVYDEPQTYEDFSGGINTDPSNEHLTDFEMRDCVNMTYLSGALVKRKGASLLSDISCDEDLHNIQGVFLFTHRVTYLIVAADGKLYYGLFNEHSTVKLNRLRIVQEELDSMMQYNPIDLFVGLQEYYEERTNILHEGFLHSYIVNDNEEMIDYTYLGDFYDVTNGKIYKDQVVSYNGVKYQCIAEEGIDKTVREPSPYKESEFWQHLGIENDLPQETIDKWRVRGEWTFRTTEWFEDDVVTVNVSTINIQGDITTKTHYFKCLKYHTSFNDYPTNQEYFKKPKVYNELIFQNTRKIEAVTYNNKLYIATGTRIIEVYLFANKLIARPISPYICNNTEITQIGFNYLSPYPEYCRQTQYNTVTTSITNILAIKNIYGSYTLTPQMTFQVGETEKDYYYRWEKKIGNNWYVIRTFESQTASTSEDAMSKSYSIEVRDADRYQYRVTFAKNFDAILINAPAWDYLTTYKVGDKVLVDNVKVYECVKAHTPSDATIPWETHFTTFQESAPSLTSTVTNDDGTSITKAYGTTIYWKLVLTKELVNILKEYSYNEDEKREIYNPQIYKDYDWSVDKVAGGYFGQATSVLWKGLEINDTFNKIQSCTKIHIDGNKLLFYDDFYNSGEWFKTIVNNPYYITDRGCLSFKTTKNEAIIKVVAFQGNIIVFANSETTGGSIHMVVGNGDDYDAQDGYYSPYRRSTKNSSISCDNPDTVQICENLLLFKYFDTVYYITASDLSNEVFQVVSCNDRIKLQSKDVNIPWDDNSCISEVTKDYYSLIWKEKYDLDNGDLVLVHPAMRVKMYYKISHQIGNKYFSPWLRDESDYLNIDFILYLKGEPIYLYNNTFISFSKNQYSDFSTPYQCKVRFRAVDLGYPKIFKLLSSVLVYSHRNQYSNIDFELESRNEAGHLLLTSTQINNSIQDLRVLRTGDIKNDARIRVDSTILDSKVFNTSYKFPFLLIDTTITSMNDKEFSISSVTYNYTSTDIPDSNPYDLYSSIIRIKEV